MKNSYHFGALLLRIIGGGLMLVHGIPKLMKVINGDFTFPNPLSVGPEASLILTVFAEFICALFILLGYRTRIASIPLMITMLVAAFIHHWADDFATKEKALLYFGIYLALFFIGSGKYSLDNALDSKS